jgi:hypothetical protein
VPTLPSSSCTPRRHRSALPLRCLPSPPRHPHRTEASLRQTLLRLCRHLPRRTTQDQCTRAISVPTVDLAKGGRRAAAPSAADGQTPATRVPDAAYRRSSSPYRGSTPQPRTTLSAEHGQRQPRPCTLSRGRLKGATTWNHTRSESGITSTTPLTWTHGAKVGG